MLEIQEKIKIIPKTKELYLIIMQNMNQQLRFDLFYKYQFFTLKPLHATLNILSIQYYPSTGNEQFSLLMEYFFLH